jgi:hypothetical protein
MMPLVGAIDPFKDEKAFAVEEHVLGKLTQSGEISAVGLSPIRKTSIAFALIVGEDSIDLIEPTLGKLHSRYDNH